MVLLLVQLDPLLREVLSRTLEQQLPACRALAADGLETAFQILRSETVDVVLMAAGGVAAREPGMLLRALRLVNARCELVLLTDESDCRPGADLPGIHLISSHEPFESLVTLLRHCRTGRPYER